MRKICKVAECWKPARETPPGTSSFDAFRYDYCREHLDETYRIMDEEPEAGRDADRRAADERQREYERTHEPTTGAPRYDR